MTEKEPSTQQPLAIDTDTMLQTYGVKNKELWDRNLGLQKEVFDLRQELATLKESTIVESMNDMKDSYRELVQENTKLKETIKKCDEKEMKSLQRKCKVYATMIYKMETMLRKTMHTNEMVKQAVVNLADDEGEVLTTEYFLDGVFSVVDAANGLIHDYIDHEIDHDRQCAQGVCSSCYRCRYEIDEHM